jgi:3-oxoacyl-[acyl-carrier-protein] synthase II
MDDKIVITGWSCLSSHGLNNEDFENFYSTRIAYKSKADWDKKNIGNQYFSSVPPFDILKEIPSLKAPFPNRYSSLGLLSCLNALKDAGLDEHKDLLEKSGLIITTTLGASKSIQEFLDKLFKKGPDKLSPFGFSKATSNSILGDVSRILKIKGPGALVYGEDSITYGIDLIKNEHSDIIICGSIDELTEVSLQVANELNRLLLPEGEDVLQHINNTQERNNFLFGESASFIIIESLQSALQRGVKIYAEIIDSVQYLDSESNKVIFERSSDDLSKNIEKLLVKNELATSERILFYGSACLPWHIKDYEWEALRNTKYSYLYANSKVGLGEGLSGSNGATIASAILDLGKNDYTNIFKGARVLQNPPANVLLDIGEDQEIKNVIVNTFSVGGVNTLLLLKKYVGR